MKRHVATPFIASLFVALAAAVANAQTTGPLTLADAIRIASDLSESVDIAEAGEARAEAGIDQAASQWLPQVSFTGSYTRTLASEFSSAFEQTGPICDPYFLDQTQPLEDRVAEIERAADCGSLVGGGLDFSNLPFGQRNIYQLGFTFSQAVWAGGRLSAQNQQASIAHDAARIATSLTRSQLALDVTRAYYDAALADRLVAIAESAYEQAAAAYEQTRLAFDAGRQPEFELLRAQVERDNQGPTVIRRQADQAIAYVRLRQVLELPEGTPIVLDVNLEDPALPAPEPFAEALARAEEAAGDEPLSVRQSRAAVEVQQAAVTIARAQRLPSISLNSSLAGVGYPSSGVFPTTGDFRANWSAGLSVQLPLFTGGRLRAGQSAAQADLDEARARLRLTEKLAELDRQTAQQDLQAAEALWRSTAGTIQQAQRAYEIAELRNREGLSTQLELSDSRLSLQVAQANRALAARDVQVARARVALLPSLPAGSR